MESLEQVRELFENSAFNKHLNIRTEIFDEGNVRCTMDVQEHHLNVNQAVHGGVLFSLLDSVMGATIRSVTGIPLVTVNMSIHYLAAVVAGEKLTARAEIAHLGRSLVTAEGFLEGEDGLIRAKTIGTFKLLRKG
ncbi:PaaI family thioesterase [Pradoshia sp.]